MHLDSAVKQAIYCGKKGFDPQSVCRECQGAKDLSHMQVWRSVILLDESQKNESFPASVCCLFDGLHLGCVSVMGVYVGVRRRHAGFLRFHSSTVKFPALNHKQGRTIHISHKLSAQAEPSTPLHETCPHACLILAYAREDVPAHTLSLVCHSTETCPHTPL